MDCLQGTMTEDKFLSAAKSWTLLYVCDNKKNLYQAYREQCTLSQGAAWPSWLSLSTLTHLNPPRITSALGVGDLLLNKVTQVYSRLPSLCHPLRKLGCWTAWTLHGPWNPEINDFLHLLAEKWLSAAVSALSSRSVPIVSVLLLNCQTNLSQLLCGQSDLVLIALLTPAISSLKILKLMS